MTGNTYQWKRFWCLRSGGINLADGGYFYDPETKWGKTCNPDLVSLEAIANIPCLVLLGEPGIGKSQELKKLINYTEEVIDKDDRILSLDLEDYSEDKLYAKLFDAQTYIDWKNGTHRLYLFLDSLDQGWLTIRKLPSLLTEEFRKLDEVSKKQNSKSSPLHLLLAIKTGFLKNNENIQGRPNLSRLYLRLVCRAFPFSRAEDNFKNLWGNHYSSYNLEPLSEYDIKTAFFMNELDPNECWKEIIDKELLSIANKPISLEFLIDKLQQNNGRFSQNENLVNIYRDGLRKLCQEQKDDACHPFQPISNLDIDQRMLIADRIAAVTTFCLLPTIWAPENSGDYTADMDVRLGQLCGQCERTSNEKGLKITSKNIQEVLDTALFSNHESNRMKYAHRTYSEFLAAWYITQHDIPLKKVRQLFFLSQDSDPKLIPQLHETAVWLASMRSDILEEIIKTDPDVILQSGVPIDIDVRAEIVKNLLKHYEQGKLFDRGRNNYRYYKKLKHPGLVEQLRTYIGDSSRQVNARDLAIDIAEACEVSALQDELAELALDSAQQINLRVSAIQAICSVGDATTRLKLKSLAIEELLEDEDDELKGYALKALWSDHLTAEELFHTLTRPKKRNFIGGYRWFLNYELVPKLKSDDIVIALHWLAGQGLRSFEHPFEELGDVILLKAWENFDLPGVAESFTQVALIQWREDQKIITHNSEQQKQFALSILEDRKKRHALVEQVVLAISETGEDTFSPLDSLTEDILVSEDIFWMLKKLQISSLKSEQEIWSKLILWKFNLEDAKQINAKQIDAIISATQSNSTLQEIFSYYLVPIELGSNQAIEARDNYLKKEERKARVKNNFLVEPPPKERVLECLDKLESGDLSGWWQLNREMTLKPESQYYDNEFELSLTQLPGWQEADAVTQRRIIEGAKTYVQQQDDVDYGWIGTNTFNRPALAGCRALQLLLTESADCLENLTSEIWQRWAPVIVAFPSSNQHKDSYLELVKYTYLNAPEELINTLIVLINKENNEHGYLFVIDSFKKCWNEKLKLTLLEKAKDPCLKPKCIGQLLEELLNHDVAEASDFAQSLVTLPLPLDEKEREKALIAARVLVEHADASSWLLIWSLVLKDSNFGRDVFELVACHNSFRIGISLTEKQIADLYLWLVCQYPYDTDTNLSNTYSDYSNDVMDRLVGTKQKISDLRNSVLSQLIERGTSKACVEIERLIQTLPELPWLQWYLVKAKANMRRKAWQPLTPEEFLQFVISQEPSPSDLYNELNEINKRTKKIEDEPKIENKINISNSPNSSINAPVGTSGITYSNVTIPVSNDKKEINWGIWLTVIGILVAIVAIPLSMSVSGAFNEEFKEWFNQQFPAKTKQQTVPKSK